MVTAPHSSRYSAVALAQFNAKRDVSDGKLGVPVEMRRAVEKRAVKFIPT